MTSIGKLTSYADIRDLVQPDAFTLTMQFLAWHNRRKMTPMMEVWRALAVAYACEERPLEQILYQGVKNFFDENQVEQPARVSDCKAIGLRLAEYLGTPH
jgi:hypothetical protein